MLIAQRALQVEAAAGQQHTADSTEKQQKKAASNSDLFIYLQFYLVALCFI